jgi:hypothetical protein
MLFLCLATTTTTALLCLCDDFDDDNISLSLSLSGFLRETEFLYLYGFVRIVYRNNFSNVPNL